MTPSYTGLGERAHLANPSIDLETHIEDMLNVIKYEDLRDIVLVGHSYGGMVATGVADRARDRVTQLIYVDAFVPDDGQSLFDINEPGRQPMQDGAKKRRRLARAADDVAAGHRGGRRRMAGARRVPMPVKCFETRLKLQGGTLTLPRSYIYATRFPPADTFGPFAKKTKSDPAWRYFEIDASHAPNVTAPEALMALLEKIVAQK